VKDSGGSTRKSPRHSNMSNPSLRAFRASNSSVKRVSRKIPNTLDFPSQLERERHAYKQALSATGIICRRCVEPPLAGLLLIRTLPPTPKSLERARCCCSSNSNNNNSRCTCSDPSPSGSACRQRTPETAVGRTVDSPSAA